VKLHAHRDLLGKINFIPNVPDLGAAVNRVVRLLLEHSGDGLTDDVLLVLGEPLAQV
jgi:hypothetical protein